MQIAQRYTEALFETLTQDQLDRVHTDLLSIESAIEGVDELREFLGNPTILKELQEQIIKKLFEKKVSAQTMTFLLFLINKSRLGLLQDICTQFDEAVLISKNIIRVTIQSSVKLTTAQVTSIKKHLKNKLQKEIKEKLVVEPAMIGGVKVYVGDEVYDYSIQAQLDEFRLHTLRAVV